MAVAEPPALSPSTVRAHVGRQRHAFLLFHAPWCSHCTATAPAFYAALARITAEHSSSTAWSVDCDAHPELIRRFSIEGAPTLLLFPANRTPSRDEAVEFPLVAELRERHVISWARQELRQLYNARVKLRDSDRPPFDDCLLREDPRSYAHAFHSNRLPLFSLCRDLRCVATTHRRQGGSRFLPQPARQAAAREQGPSSHDDSSHSSDVDSGDGVHLGSLPGQRIAEIREVACVGPHDEAAAAMQVQEALGRQAPLVLRGCSRSMPAITRWMDDGHLRAVRGDSVPSTAPLAALLTERQPEEVTDSAQEASATDGELSMRVADALRADTAWPSPLSALLQSLTSLPHVWASSGGKFAALHFDSVDNVHAIVSGEKDFLLVSPGDIEQIYLDFPANQDDQAAVACPGALSFGCDAFSCYTYAPFSAENIDAATLSRFPLIANVTVHKARSLQAGDAVLVPAFWAHSVIHYPRRGSGRNIALSFTRPGHAGLATRPFSTDIRRLWNRARSSGDERAEQVLPSSDEGRLAAAHLDVDQNATVEAVLPIEVDIHGNVRTVTIGG